MKIATSTCVVSQTDLLVQRLRRQPKTALQSCKQPSSSSETKTGEFKQVEPVLKIFLFGHKDLVAIKYVM